MDFRKMRRSRQELPAAQTEKILRDGSTGVLSVLGENGYPYALPLNYVYLDGKIYFHCARTGHKLDAIRQCEKVSFCVVERDSGDSPRLCHRLPQRHFVWPGAPCAG